MAKGLPITRCTYCWYTLSCPPEDALGHGIDYWRSQGCRTTKRDVNARLLPLGWTGAEMRGGSRAGGFFGAAGEGCMEVFPPAGLPFLLVARLLRTAYVVNIAASPSSSQPGATDLVFFRTGPDRMRDSALYGAEEFVKARMQLFRDRVAPSGFLLSGPWLTTEQSLPDSHPLAPANWQTIRRGA